MRLLHVHSGNLYGGIEVLLEQLVACGGARLENEFALCFEGRLAEGLRAKGAPLYPLGAVRFSRPWTVLRARLRLQLVLRRAPPDVALTHSAWSHAAFAPVIRRKGIPLVHQMHGAPNPRFWLERLARRTPPELVLAVSRYTASLAPSLFPGTPVQVLYAPVAPARGGAGDRDALRRELRATPDATVIVQVSRMEASKGHGVLLEALARLRERRDWACWLVGGAQRPSETAYVKELEARAASLGLAERVAFLDERSDVRALLGAADIFCQANTGPEGFGRVFVEAMYAGLPVVASAADGPAEIVDATCGVLVPPGEAAPLAAALSRLLDDPARRAALGRGGVTRARALCDPETQMRKLEALLSGMVRRGGRR